MVPELAVHQRGLVDRKILFADSEVEARYILPFVDRRWKIPFAVLDLREGRPLVFDGPFRLDRFRFRTVSRTDELRPSNRSPPTNFASSRISIHGGCSGARRASNALG